MKKGKDISSSQLLEASPPNYIHKNCENLEHGFESMESSAGCEVSKENFKNFDLFGHDKTDKTQKTLGTTKRTSINIEKGNNTQYEESKVALDENTMQASTIMSQMKKNKYKAAKADPTQFGTFSHREQEEIY